MKKHEINGEIMARIVKVCPKLCNLYLVDIVTHRPIARQRLGKNVPTNTQPTIEDAHCGVTDR
jgi:hypothetical protein